nr:uncharacterized protein LOC112742959 [Arachis hypogaea]
MCRRTQGKKDEKARKKKKKERNGEAREEEIWGEEGRETGKEGTGSSRHCRAAAPLPSRRTTIAGENRGERERRISREGATAVCTAGPYSRCCRRLVEGRSRVRTEEEKSFTTAKPPSQQLAATKARHCCCATTAERGSDAIKERRRKETRAPSEPVSPSRHRSCLAVAIQATAESPSMKLQPPPSIFTGEQPSCLWLSESRTGEKGAASPIAAASFFYRKRFLLAGNGRWICNSSNFCFPLNLRFYGCHCYRKWSDSMSLNLGQEKRIFSCFWLCGFRLIELYLFRNRMKKYYEELYCVLVYMILY